MYNLYVKCVTFFRVAVCGINLVNTYLALCEGLSQALEERQDERCCLQGYAVQMVLKYGSSHLR